MGSQWTVKVNHTVEREIYNAEKRTKMQADVDWTPVWQENNDLLEWLLVLGK